jgi:CheY-like chemotaxis protein
VDDDPDVRESLSILLETHGYQVHSAVHGADALRQLVAGYVPDVMVLDLDMPVMDGFQVLDELRKHQGWSGIRIIMLTALRDSRIWALGVHDYLTKPVDVTALLSAVETQWSIHQGCPAE